MCILCVSCCSASSHEAERCDYISFHLEQKESVKIEFKVETRTLAELQNENNSFFFGLKLCRSLLCEIKSKFRYFVLVETPPKAFGALTHNITISRVTDTA